MKKGIQIFSLFLIFCIFVFISWKYANNNVMNVKMFDEYFPVNSEVIDLTEYELNSDNWQDKLEKFPKLKSVKIKNYTLSLEDKDALQNKYINVDFYTIPYVDFYGKKIKLNVDSIKVEKVILDDQIFSLLAKFPNLKTVDMMDIKVTLDQQLKLVERFPNLFFKWKVDIFDKVVESDITTLDLSKKKNIEYSKFTKMLKVLPKLDYLRMSYTNLSNEQLDSIRKSFPNIKVVWTISFGVWSVDTDAVSFSTLVGGFQYIRLTNKDIEGLKYLKDLQALDLGHQSITDLSFIADNFPNLRVLIMADNKKISDLKPLTKLKHLHYLELFINNITDISPLAELKELVDLNLCYNNIRDYDSIIDAKLPLLERIWLVGCPISANDLKRLKEAYPNAKIVNYGSGSTNSGWRSIDRYFVMIDMFNKRNYISDIFTKYDR